MSNTVDNDGKDMNCCPDCGCTNIMHYSWCTIHLTDYSEYQKKHPSGGIITECWFCHKKDVELRELIPSKPQYDGGVRIRLACDECFRGNITA